MIVVVSAVVLYAAAIFAFSAVTITFVSSSLSLSSSFSIFLLCSVSILPLIVPREAQAGFPPSSKSYRSGPGVVGKLLIVEGKEVSMRDDADGDGGDGGGGGGGDGGGSSGRGRQDFVVRCI